MTTTPIPDWPHVSAVARPDGGEVTINGTSHPVTGDSVATVRQAILAKVAETAQSVGRPVKVTATDPDGTWPLIVHPNGHVEAGEQAEPEARRTRRARAEDTAAPSRREVQRLGGDDHPASAPAAVITAEPELALEPAPAAAGADPAAAGTAAWVQNAPEPQTLAAPAPMTRREALSQSFLTENRDEAPPEAGWRGLLARVGIKIQPSLAELAERADERAVSQHWPGPRTIAIVNGKGGANKTPTTILLSALLARYGGSGVLAWDNNPTRGTLGWRTEQGPHENTVLDLLPRTDALLAPDARAAELAHYVHHQTRDKYDVLRSHPEVLATDQRITAADFDALHTVASKYFRLIVIDSGNDESAESWLRMIDHTDQLVVATTTREEHAESGRLLLDELSRRDAHSANLAENAVAIVSHASTNEAGPKAITEGFSRIAREAVAIPYDPKLSGRPLHYDALDQRTQRAWLRAAAAVAGGL
ncbi:MinD-like ATPase involved in chromosome partitioning or flagellar assembly [Georgenia soli]|uniref:MinD-like ATPase involved in chromosome partitioning or flagellar assembly n=1 Tax=Georgenia soli TaxID=638953 RepID=A0A2A9F2C3_9MICO|nr:ParA family protein [Georgenia soli]PFG45143.1 MinD-like ATPase involved in chromosome partitioning or flagellar assembly [Georgenia soli]